MIFTYDGEFYKIVKITGPSHNLLGLSFFNNNEDIIETSIIALDEKNSKVQNIEKKDIMQQVKLGLEEANKKFSVNYKIKKIQYLKSDTYSSEIYKELTKIIIKNLLTR